MKKKHYLILAVIVITACVSVLHATVKFSFDPRSEGFFILRGDDGHWIELTDDVVPEDARRLIWAMPRYPFRSVVESTKCSDLSYPCVDFRWNKRLGRGFIRNTWPNGRKLIINLGRFKDSNGQYPKGLFIGGGLPPSDPDYRHLNNEATGMTYFDGQRWYHVWCNSNEGLISPAQPFLPSYVSDWEFKGSWITENDKRQVTIESRHSLMFTGVPLDFHRLLFYFTGTSYVILATEITNRGKVPVTFQYMYGDEPWIGDFGSSSGDVGWMGKELILTEREIDTRLSTYFGMFDYGNELAGEDHSYTGIANFIEWEKDSRPTKAYISNFSGGASADGRVIPLTSRGNRFIGLQYGPSTLMPGQSLQFTIAVGMAEKDPKTGFPVKPGTGLNP